MTYKRNKSHNHTIFVKFDILYPCIQLYKEFINKLNQSCETQIIINVPRTPDGVNKKHQEHQWAIVLQRPPITLFQTNCYKVTQKKVGNILSNKYFFLFVNIVFSISFSQYFFCLFFLNKVQSVNIFFFFFVHIRIWAQATGYRVFPYFHD